jgi:NADH dehydrogenase (ubiquinone) 1 alpha/beta subcomplex 1
VTTSSTFKELGLDSLDAVELVMAMEEEFAVQIPDDDADKIQSIPSAIEYFSNHPHAR